MQEFVGKTAFVTGAASGIGFTLSHRECADAEFKVWRPLARGSRTTLSVGRLTKWYTSTYDLTVRSLSEMAVALLTCSTA